MEKGYLVRHAKDVVPTPCPCGSSTRIFTHSDGPVANVHVTHIQDSRRHYHNELTEIYYILEGRGAMELGDDTVPVEPGVAIMIGKHTPHRGSGDFKALIVGVPAWHPEDEHLADASEPTRGGDGETA